MFQPTLEDASGKRSDQSRRLQVSFLAEYRNTKERMILIPFSLSFRVLERVGARSLSAHLRTLADFLVYEFSVSAAGQHVKKVSNLFPSIKTCRFPLYPIDGFKPAKISSKAFSLF